MLDHNHVAKNLQCLQAGSVLTQNQLISKRPLKQMRKSLPIDFVFFDSTINVVGPNSNFLELIGTQYNWVKIDNAL